MKFESIMYSLLLFCMFLVILFLGLVIYDFYFSSSQELILLSPSENISAVSNTIIDSYPGGILFYPNIRFSDRKISYSIDIFCSESRAEHAREAFKILEENTILDFSEIQADGQIKVICDDREQEPRAEYFIAGEGGPNSIVNASNYYVVTNGTIFIYKETSCRVPVIPIHEILHVLGFRHSTNKNSIMYEISNCEQKITSEIISTINELYQDPAFPDLIIPEVSAAKRGGFLDFNIEIINAGLARSEETKLSVYADDEKIADYEIIGLNIGSGRILRVTNLRVSRSTETVSFKIDSQEQVLEINEGNNEMVLKVEE